MAEDIITITRYWHGYSKSDERAAVEKTFVEYRNALVPEKAFLQTLDGHIKDPKEIERLVIGKLVAK